jgi:SAM-dependent methyltransferase
LSAGEPSDPYDGIAEFYDLDHDRLDADIEMYLDFVKSAGDPVLEVACGTGRIAGALANAGFTVVGTDISRAMLRGAKQRAESSSTQHRLTVLPGAMNEAHVAPAGPFGVVIIGLGALSHAPTQGQQIEVLRSAYQALDPRGLLLIDVLHATPVRLSTMDGSVSHDGTWQLDDGSEVDRFSAHTVLPASQHIDTRLWYDVTSPSGSLRRVSTSMTHRYLSPGELMLMLERAGFQETLLYGSYDLSPLEDDSDRLIAAADVTRTP